MHFPSSLPPLATSFFRPLADLLPGLPHQRSCPELPDADWLLPGISRVLENEPSGRAFLQKAATSPLTVPGTSSFFEALASPRRLLLTQAANEALARFMTRTLTDPFAAFPALASFDLHAGDGHFHAAAVHDPRDAKGTKYATGHVYLMDLRTQAMRHLDLCDKIERLKEHDLRLLKRNGYDALRGPAPKGRKVIVCWDRAIIDFAWWQKGKDTKGLYIITRPKSNTQLTRTGYNEYDRADPVNAGILSDELAAPAATARVLRRITWTDPATGESWQYLTNEMTLEPGLIVLLYRRRWDIEKTYDTFKNKFHEQKSWASNTTAKSAQAAFLCLTHNLTVLHDQTLADCGIVNTAELKRRAGRLGDLTVSATKAGRLIPCIIAGFQRLTQRSVKFVRWLRQNLWSERPLPDLWAILTKLYRIS